MKNKTNLPVFISGLILAFALFGDSLLYGILPVHAADFGIPLVFVGIALSINRWVRLLSNPLSVKVFRRIGFNLTMTLGCIITVFVSLVYAYPASLVLLRLTY